jgi:hypothetical protein
VKDDHHEDRYTAGDIDLIIPVRWYHSGLSSPICNNRLAHGPLNEKGFFSCQFGEGYQPVRQQFSAGGIING